MGDAPAPPRGVIRPEADSGGGISHSSSSIGPPSAGVPRPLGVLVPITSSRKLNRLPDRLGARALLKLCRGLIERGSTVPLKGLATTTVFGEVAGGGVGESVRKSGWMCASEPLVNDGVVGRDDDGNRREWVL
jgi:hypothetical protein